jgi:hypothetical protein
VGAAVDEEDWSRRELSSNLSRQEQPTLAVGSVAVAGGRGRRGGEESRMWRQTSRGEQSSLSSGGPGTVASGSLPL